MKLKILLILLCIYFSFPKVIAQKNPVVDSLDKLFKTTPKDTNHVKWGIKIAQELMYVDAVSAKEYCFEALKIANEQKWDKGSANCLHIVGYIYLMEGNNSEALSKTQESLKLR